MSPRRTCLEVDSQGSYPKGAKATPRENKAKIKIAWRLSKGRLEAERASLREYSPLLKSS
jgi:hypothetical protein